MEKNDIFMIYGQNAKAMAKEILDACALDALIGDKNKKIGIKPNLVVARPASDGATTHPELVEGVILYLKEKGYHNITIMEGCGIGASTASSFRACGFTALADKYSIKLIDTQKDSAKAHDCRGLPITICNCAFSVDFMINMPVLKAHCQTAVTCALKNNKGLIPDSEKRRFHTMGLHKPIAHLNTALRNDFILVDGLCGDLSFEEGGNPVQMNRVLAMRDPVLCDAFVCDLIGYSLQDVPYISMAAKLGLGECDTSKANVTELNTDQNNTEKLVYSRKVDRLGKYTKQKDACSACYGSLIHALDRISDKGMLSRIKQPICIGQGYKGDSGEAGVGSCTHGFKKSVPGCPPKAIDIVNFIENELL